MTREQVIATILRVAGQYSSIAEMPRLLLACAVAESRLNPTARRPTNPAQDAAFWPDVSGGLHQQTVRYDPEYQGGNEYPGPAEVSRVLDMQYDPERSSRVAAQNLAGKWGKYRDTFKALCAYNWPVGGGRPYTPAHEANYRYGIQEADSIMKGGPTVPTSSPYCFPVEGYPKGRIPLHWNVSKSAADLFAPRGAKVRAMVGGRIEDAGWNSIGGWSVYLIGDPITRSLHYYMAHLRDKPLVATGDRVSVGQHIGYVGDTGNAAAAGPHLHIGIGFGIQDGSGPEGGGGIDYDANGYLQRVLDAIGSGPVGPVSPVEPRTETVESYGIRMRYLRDVVAPATRDSWRNLEAQLSEHTLGPAIWRALGAALDSLERTVKDG